jgi:hypothetical protein
MDASLNDTHIDDTDESSKQYIDKITLELLTNKPRYKKYLETTDPKQYSKINQLHHSINKYKHIIMDITNELCNNPDDNSRTDDITKSYIDFAKNCIKYIKTKELETDNPYNNNINIKDDEYMFSECDDIERKIKNDYKVYDNNDTTKDYNSDDSEVQSYWGEGAIKLQTSYDIRMLAKKRR